MGSNQCLPHFCEQPIPKSENKNWMAKLPNNTLLSEMTIPGTHDSGAIIRTKICETQSWSIKNQLIAGIRCLDIRVISIDDKLKAKYGITEQTGFFNDILNDIIIFLRENPSETVIMQVVNDYSKTNSKKTYDQLFNYYTKKIKDKIIIYDNKDFELQELRGKILVIKVYEKGLKSYSGIIVQNRYEVTIKNIFNDKIKEINKHLRKEISFIEKGKLYFSFFCSSRNYLLVNSREMSKIINKLALDYNGRMGIVVTDFPGEDLIYHLIDQNFKKEIGKMINFQNFILDNCIVVNIMHFDTHLYIHYNKELEQFSVNKNPFNFFIISKNNHRYIEDGEKIILSSLDINNDIEINCEIKKVLPETKKDKINTKKNLEKKNSINDNIENYNKIEYILNGDLIVIKYLDSKNDNLKPKDNYLSYEVLNKEQIDEFKKNGKKLKQSKDIIQKNLEIKKNIFSLINESKDKKAYFIIIRHN